MFTVQSRNLQDKVTDNRHKKVTFIISTTSRMEAFWLRKQPNKSRELVRQMQNKAK